jgi:hypothetical protein
MRALPSMGYAAVARNVSWKEHARETRFDFSSFHLKTENSPRTEELPAARPCLALGRLGRHNLFLTGWSDIMYSSSAVTGLLPV